MAGVIIIVNGCYCTDLGKSINSSSIVLSLGGFIIIITNQVYSHETFQTFWLVRIDPR